jgi:hypothetical protein
VRAVQGETAPSHNQGTYLKEEALGQADRAAYLYPGDQRSAFGGPVQGKFCQPA